MLEAISEHDEPLRESLEESQGMVQDCLAKKLVNVTFYKFFRCPFFALGPQFHENHDISEVVNCNVKLLH